jgi:diketogulonate reductase-like aldo/keto reductase
MIHNVKANGVEIPAIGLGTWDLRRATCETCVAAALDAGYRHIDTAAMYDNEHEVGHAVRASSIPRDEIFLTTKVWYDNAGDGPLQRSVEDSLVRFKLDYVDLVLMHWPDKGTPIVETMRALEDVKARGLARHVGVSNFTVPLIEEAVTHSSQPLALNQVEFHPYLDQSRVLEACRKHGLALTAYSPLAKGRVFDEPVLREIGENHNKNAGQVTLRWLVQQEHVIAIPRSSKPANIIAAYNIADFMLSKEEMKRISGIAHPNGRMVDFDFAPDWD